MKTISYMKSKLKELNSLFPQADIEYEYKEYLNTHIVDIRPTSFFEMDEAFIDFQIQTEKEFSELFSDEELLFITKNELIQVTNPILKLGPSQIECSTEWIAGYMIGYTNDYREYFVDTAVKSEYVLPKSPPIKSRWKNPFKHKKSLEHNGDFLYKLAS